MEQDMHAALALPTITATEMRMSATMNEAFLADILPSNCLWELVYKREGQNVFIPIAIMKMMKKEIDKKGKGFLGYLAFILIVIGFTFVYGLTAGVPPNPGHGIEQVSAPAGCAANQVLQWTGSGWTCLTSGIANNIAVFDSSGSWTVPAGVTKIRARVWGGGGGGGGSTGASGGAGGGGGGAYAESVLSVTPGTTYTVTVGSGGSGGSGRQNGTAGGQSSFSTLVRAGGGSGGQWDGPDGISASGGTGSGQITISGGGGGIGGTNEQDGSGGDSPLGGMGGVSGTNAAVTGNNGRPGIIPGGGGGGSANSNTCCRAGGAGARGRVIIEY